MKLHLSSAVAQARAAGRPLVALESSVLAQGLKPPHNREAARRCEAAVRAGGAVPATIAVLDGEIWCGLEEAQLERMCTVTDAMKIGERDLGVAIARGATGGTTVSATCRIAAEAGIAVFSTGGLGGVHRDVAQAFDVSQDLGALARWPVAVVCAGAKSVLDVPKTLELLETLGVPVIGFGTDELPGFYTRETGLKLEHSVRDAAEAAAVVRAHVEVARSGLVLAVPPPSETAIPRAEIDEHLERALREAHAAGISGKAVTPFLLASMALQSGGRSVVANLALLEHNASVAAAVAGALAAGS